MSLSVILGAFWVLSATFVALLPMRLQYAPGVTLLALAPVLIGYIGYEHGWIAALAALAAFISMFRHPLRFFWRKFRGMETGGPQS